MPLSVALDGYRNLQPLAGCRLPFQWEDISGSFQYVYSFETVSGMLELEFFFNYFNSNTPEPDIQTYLIPTARFKVIAVNGTVVDDMKRAQVHMDNYTEVDRFTVLWQKGRMKSALP